MAAQPFYHRAVVLFVATKPLTGAEVEKLLHDALEALPEDRRRSVIVDSVEVEESDTPEPGDPADL